MEEPVHEGESVVVAVVVAVLVLVLVLVLVILSAVLVLLWKNQYTKALLLTNASPLTAY